MRRILLFWASIPIAVGIACSGSDDVSVGDDTSGDGGGDDATSRQDARGSDASADSGPTVTYGDITDAKSWSYFDLGSLYPKLDGAPSNLPSGFLGAVFDGHFVYYVPTGNKTSVVGIGSSNAYDIVRFDTTAPFDAPTSFEKSSVASRGANAAFIGGTFADGFVYFAPYQSNPFLRFDTTRPFTDGGGLESIGSAPVAAFGAAYGSHAIFYAPLTGQEMQRFDTNDGGFASFFATGVDAGAPAYQGVAFDGKYAYFAPATGGALSTDVSTIVRVDTTSDFTNAASWSTFDTHNADATSGNFAGTVFDGRYVYFVPTATNAGTPVDARFVRYDTTSAFTDKSSWSVFAPMNDASSTGYHTAGFDGRYVYYLPLVASGTSLLLRYDTTASFGDAGSWTYFALDSFRPDATGFEGMTFDGSFMYFVPRYGHVAARFSARSPAALPPGFHGSFL